MTTDGRREILERVASGELSPEEAEALLGGSSDPAGDSASGSPVRRIRVEAGFGALKIVGDPGVQEAEVDGIHTATVEGDTLVIAGETPEGAVDGPGVFSIDVGRRRARPIGRRLRVGLVGHLGGLGALRIRVNPDLELDARIEAGPMSISGIAGPIRARSSAGPIRIDGLGGPMDVAVNAGAIRIRGRFDSGESRIRSDAGGIRVELDPDSNVHILASAALGKVVLPDGDAEAKGFGSTREATIGSGTATLRVETAMGSINVSTDEGTA